MLFAQILNDDLGCASYLVGCEEAGEAVVVDPPLAIETDPRRGQRLGVRIVRTLETHTHADHVSGHGRLALEHGSRSASTRRPRSRTRTIPCRTATR